MKVILIISALLICFFSCNYINEISRLELTVYNLYKSGFSDYLIFVNGDTLSYDKEGLKQYMEEKGYKINFFTEENLHFHISFKNIFVYKKEFKFNLVKNDEF